MEVFQVLEKAFKEISNLIRSQNSLSLSSHTLSNNNSGDDVNSDEVHFGSASAVTLEIVDDSTPTSGITINFVSGDASGPDLNSITLSVGMHSDITYSPPLGGGATSITFASTGSSISPLTMGIAAQ